MNNLVLKFLTFHKTDSSSSRHRDSFDNMSCLTVLESSNEAFCLPLTYLSSNKPSWQSPYITQHVWYHTHSKAAIFRQLKDLPSWPFFVYSNMLGSWRHKCLLFTLLAFIVLSEGSRLPREYWEQMLPKKLPTPSSSPSKGTNSVTKSSSKAVEAYTKLPYSSDGKV